MLYEVITDAGIKEVVVGVGVGVLVGVGTNSIKAGYALGSCHQAR